MGVSTVAGIRTCRGDRVSRLSCFNESKQFFPAYFAQERTGAGYSWQGEPGRFLHNASYEIRYEGNGRLRLGIHKASHAVVSHVEKLFGMIPGIEDVSWNELSGSLLILYDAYSFSSPQMRGIADEVLGTCGIHPAGSRNRELLWSLAAGVTIVISLLLRKAVPEPSFLVQGLEMVGFGMTAYSVITHRGRMLGGPKSLHLDSILAMLSIFNLGSAKALVGLFLTWLVNFLEIVGWKPIYSRM